ncbi:unnamed protein product, partial [Closterium sp. NIES-53]
SSGMGLVLGGRGPVVLTGHVDASWVDDSATQRSSQGYTFSLGSGSVSWWSTRSFLVLNSSCEADFYAGAMAAQELRWLTYLLTDLGEQPRSPPVLYVDNKAIIALCHEHRLEHRTKHIALRYFLAQELQQRGQLHLAYMATRDNTADIFTKALPPGPAPVARSSGERFFLVVVDDFSFYTTVFPLQRKAHVADALIRWWLATSAQRALPVLCLHTDHGGEFRSCVLAKLGHGAKPRDITFDEFVSFYTCYPYRCVPVPPPPLFLVPTPPLGPDPQVLPPHPGPAPLAGGAGARGTGTGGAGSRGTGVGDLEAAAAIAAAAAIVAAATIVAATTVAATTAAAAAAAASAVEVAAFIATCEWLSSPWSSSSFARTLSAFA